MKQSFKTTIGGQALIEGVMMKGPSKTAYAVRKPDGDIAMRIEKNNSILERVPFLNVPILRGAVKLIEAMLVGVDAIIYSASFWEVDEDEEGFLEKHFPKHHKKMEEVLSVLISLLSAVIFFMILPNLMATFFQSKIENHILLNLMEGVFRIFIFFLYLGLISKQKDIARVFQYHGAEHKSIACYEAGAPLTVDEVRKYSRLHPRCGTSFLFMVLVISVVVLSFFGWPSLLGRIIVRLLMFPVIAGIGFEVNRLIGKYDNRLTLILRYPGLMIQKYFTVKEPNEEQMEVGIASLKAVLPEDGEDDTWN
ncbi:DUF1385 domain-containing protein [Aedoeadaptatus coxii]|uniref:DUF1385 domain-containing protein n=1 Tax=Aedoeadaptatus coxii TaxID=755172 RepID=A0A134ABG0_9FIRM|nr:DUF1385 domain-containing protein [Peptoniphilus coxii]KXB65049.1 hypothetical protein HMPREF1863_01557 [Peptoniphilus coxii]